MKIIIDSNIIFSALIKDSETRRLIFELEHELLFPEYIFEEFLKHKRLILEKSKLSEEELNQLLSRILKYIKIIPTKETRPFKKEAYNIAKNIDMNDVIFDGL